MCKLTSAAAAQAIHTGPFQSLFLQEEDDAGFAGAVVQALNLILLTSSQLQVKGAGRAASGSAKADGPAPPGVPLIL